MKKKIIIFLIPTIILAILFFISKSRANVLEIYIFNLKSGNSVFIRTPNDRRILFGSGGSQEILRKLTSILPFYDKDIDSIIEPDSEEKNTILFPQIIQRFNVKDIFIPAVNIGNASSSNFAIKNRMDKVNNIKEVLSQDILYKEDDLIINSEFPAKVEDFQYSKSSPPSIILRIKYQDLNLLVIGKASKKIQKYISSKFSNISTNQNVLVTFKNDTQSNISRELSDKLNITNMIYSKQKGTKTKSDDEYHDKDLQRINIKDYSYIKITKEIGSISIKGFR